MRTMDTTRSVECFLCGEWVPAYWEQLDQGDIIRFVHKDGLPANSFYDGKVFIVSETPHLLVDKTEDPSTKEKVS